VAGTDRICYIGCAPLTLSASLRRKEDFIFQDYPAFYDSAPADASGTCELYMAGAFLVNKKRIWYY
jgi:hypothetical protein